jgi:predicted Holliday junction resolvase-like endonuclease
MATVIPVNPDEPKVELMDDALRVQRADFGGTIVDLAHDLELHDQPQRLIRLLTDATEVGATILRNGQNVALVESVALEIDRLVATTGEESERLPEALKKPLGEHLQTLSDLLAEHFDPKRARSMQRQLPTIVGEATGAELRRLVQEMLSESGAVGAQLKLFSSSSTETLVRVNTLLNRIEQKLKLDEQIERSAHKGRPFEEIVQAELEAIHGSLGDEVRCVRADYGLQPKNGKGAKAGDFVVIVNPEHTHGREVSFVVEAKTGPLRAAEAKRELEMAIKNRGAVAGVLVFDGVDDAPLGGRTFMHHGDGRLTAVLDLESGVPFAFEVACKEARGLALASLKAEGELDPFWLQDQCNQLCEVVERASAMLDKVSAIERNSDAIRDIYGTMRERAFALVDEIGERCN